jgi:hypothetical protein
MFLDMISDVTKLDDSISGYVASAEEAEKVLKQFQLETASRFVCVKRPGHFGKKGLLASKRIYNIPFKQDVFRYNMQIDAFH